MMRHIEIDPSWTERLNAGALAPLQGVLRVAFFLAMAALAYRLWRPGFRRAPSAHRWFSVAVSLLFIAVWLHQGWWQLAGDAQPRFLSFLRRYDRRPDAAIVRPVRGRILDAAGLPLAEDDPDRSGVRRYPLGPAAAHAVGFLHPRYGVYGVEGAADRGLGAAELSSREGRRRYGRQVLSGERVRGADLRLTLDGGLQRTAAQLLEGVRGAIVVLRAADGAILAIASAPAFDPEDPAPALAADPADAPMVHRALHGRYPPGSSFKILSAALAIEQGDPGVLECPAEGYIPAPGARPIRDYDYYAAQRDGRVWAGHGRLSFRDAFARSSNVYFAQVGVRAVPDRMAELIERVRIGSAFEIFSGSSGRISAHAGTAFATADLHRGRRAQISIGQGDLLVTPLHMAVLASAVANDGWVWAPHIAADAPRIALGRFFRPETARRLQGLMRDAVREGTGRRAAAEGVTVAGKTGTAQNPRGADHAWFVGFAPAERPVLAFAVLVEHGGSGGGVAAPRASALVAAARDRGLLTPAERPEAGR